MEPRHQNAARRRTHGIARVMLCEAESLSRHLVESGRLDLFLAITAELRGAEIVGQDVDNVWLARLAGVERHDDPKSNNQGNVTSNHGISPCLNGHCTRCFQTLKRTKHCASFSHRHPLP